MKPASSRRGLAGLTIAIMAVLPVLATPTSAAAQPTRVDRVQVLPGKWIDTGLDVQAGDQIAVQAGGSVSCAQCTGIKQSGPSGISGSYKLWAQVSRKPIDISTPVPQAVEETGRLYLRIGDIQDAHAAYWQGGYVANVIRYPRAGGGGGNPMPPSTDISFQAWPSENCRRLETEGLTPGTLNTAGGNSLQCTIYMEDWVINTSDAVWVCLPGATLGDNWVGHPSGIVVYFSGFVQTWNMSGYQVGFQEGWPKHTGHSVFPWSLSFAARPNAQSSTIPVEVYQGKACGQPTGPVRRFEFPVKVVRSPTFAVSTAPVFWVGYQMATAAAAISLNWDPTVTRNALASASQWAATTGGFIGTSPLETLVNALNQGAGNAGVSQSVTQLHGQYNQWFQRNCNCGVGFNLLNAYATGYNLCLAEIATLNGWDASRLRDYLTLARNSAAASNQLLPVNGIDQALAYLNQGGQSAQLKQFVTQLRDQFGQLLNRQCTCSP